LRSSELAGAFPLGSTADPKAETSEVTSTELVQARDLTTRANVGRAIERESEYSCENGWPMPDWD